MEGRRSDWYSISSPMSLGSGELIEMHAKLPSMQRVKSTQSTEQLFYKTTFGVHSNGLCYKRIMLKGTILQGYYGKMIIL